MAQAEPPLVPEGIHSPATQQPKLCGFTAANLTDLQQKIMSDPGFREENSNDRYRVFNRQEDYIQFVFPRPGFLEFGMATCMKLVQTSAGTTMERSMHCEGTRAECDKIFIEWEEHDKEVRQSLHQKERG
jgi:hypothetical protein